MGRFAIWVWRALPVLLAAAAPAAETTVETIDGRTFVGRLTAISAVGVTMVLKREPVVLAAADVGEIRFAVDLADPLAKRGQAVIRTRRGGLLGVDDVAVDGGRLTGRSDLLGAIAVDVGRISAIVLPNRRTTPAAVEKIAATLVAAADGDRLVVRAAPQEYVPVAGVLKSIAADKITFVYADEDRTIDTAKVVAVKLASVAGDRPQPRGVLLAADGTRLPFDAAELTAGAVGLRGTPVGDVSIPIDRIAAIRYHSGRVTYLSDLTPSAIEQTGAFGPVFTYRNDRSAANIPLQLDGRTYARGVGLHSRCTLTYNLAGARYQTFVALVGIDDTARPRGDAVLTLSADGKPLAGPITLTGSGPAGTKLTHPIRLDVRGVKLLTIAVDFGADLDVGDHVNLADAKLIGK